jgi:hypothetical protein
MSPWKFILARAAMKPGRPRRGDDAAAILNESSGVLKWHERPAGFRFSAVARIRYAAGQKEHCENREEVYCAQRNVLC